MTDSTFMQGVFEKLTLETHQGREALYVAIENCRLLDQKQKDYGPLNISKFGELGVIVRVNDKWERMLNLNRGVLNGGAPTPPIAESIDDTWRDIANYATIALMLRKGVWIPKT